ncbi:MAG TPA: TlpA disulfide reductase family protein [Kiritimatiellia bacterium]|nr:TlpA disulfide reductase family protein [Kiritimatiellia bacterium]
MTAKSWMMLLLGIALGAGMMGFAGSRGTTSRLLGIEERLDRMEQILNEPTRGQTDVSAADREPGKADEPSEALYALEVVRVTPEPPATIPNNGRVSVTIRYRSPEDVPVRIWAVGRSGGLGPSGFSYAASQELPGGKGEVERWFKTEEAGVSESFRISMVDSQTRERVAELIYPARYTWQGEPVTMSPVTMGTPFPDLSFVGLDGKRVDLGTLRGKVVMIDFWATWCGPCVAKMPYLKAAYDKYHPHGFEIVGISLDRDRERLERHLSENNIRWPNHFDGRGWENEIAQRFNIRRVPSSFLIDRNGILRQIDVSGQSLERFVAAMLE